MTPQWRGLINGTIVYIVFGVIAMVCQMFISNVNKPSVPRPRGLLRPVDWWLDHMTCAVHACVGTRGFASGFYALCSAHAMCVLAWADYIGCRLS